MLRKKGFGKQERVNVIPILDAVFIFIFFLLMSAQFIDLYEINTKKPIIEEVSSNTSAGDIKSKNFRVHIFEEEIRVTEGMKEKLVSKFKWEDGSFSEFRAFLIKLKKDNLKENSIIVKPHKNVDFKRVIKVVDAAQQYVTLPGSKKEKIFRSVAFESME